MCRTGRILYRVDRILDWCASSSIRGCGGGLAALLRAPSRTLAVHRGRGHSAWFAFRSRSAKACLPAAVLARASAPSLPAPPANRPPPSTVRRGRPPAALITFRVFSRAISPRNTFVTACWLMSGGESSRRTGVPSIGAASWPQCNKSLAGLDGCCVACWAKGATLAGRDRAGPSLLPASSTLFLARPIRFATHFGLNLQRANTFDIPILSGKPSHEPLAAQYAPWCGRSWSRPSDVQYLVLRRTEVSAPFFCTKYAMVVRLTTPPHTASA